MPSASCVRSQGTRAAPRAARARAPRVHASPMPQRARAAAARRARRPPPHPHWLATTAQCFGHRPPTARRAARHGACRARAGAWPPCSGVYSRARPGCRVHRAPRPPPPPSAAAAQQTRWRRLRSARGGLRGRRAAGARHGRPGCARVHTPGAAPRGLQPCLPRSSSSNPKFMIL